MNQPAIFDVYTARFPYIEGENYKIRPVIIVSEPYGSHGVLAVIPLTSKSGREPVDYAIADWRGAGLLQPSIARIHRISTIITERLAARVGTLNNHDITRLKQSLKLYLNL